MMTTASDRVVIHFEGDDSETWNVGRQIMFGGEVYELTRLGLNEMVAELVGAGFLIPVSEPGHYQAVVPGGAQ